MRNAPLIVWTVIIVAGLVASAPLLLASDKTATDSDGYKTVRLRGAGGKSAYIRVKVQPDPGAHLSSPSANGKYNPNDVSLNKTSSFANKTYSSTSLFENKNADALRDEHNFVTKPYFFDHDSVSHLTDSTFNAKAAFPATNTYNRPARGLDKSYPATRTDASLNKSAQLGAGPSELQNRTANLGSEKASVYASSLANKAYLGPEAEMERHDMDKLSQGLMQVKDLPNRPLTIDEVRALINHGIKPNTDAPPEPPSRPLNDPNYQPDPAPPPLAQPQTPPDTADEDLPSPGIMAARHESQEPPPENSEPLPK